LTKDRNFKDNLDVKLVDARGMNLVASGAPLKKGKNGKAAKKSSQETGRRGLSQ
jgi:hypothetical protein